MKNFILLFIALLLFFELHSQNSIPVEIKNVQITILSKDTVIKGSYKTTFSQKKINRALIYDDGIYKIVSVYKFKKRKNKTISKNGFEFYLNNKKIKDPNKLKNDLPFCMKLFSRSQWSGRSIDTGLRTLSMKTSGQIEIKRKSKKWMKIKCDYYFY
jgi:hypothetical protein